MAYERKNNSGSLFNAKDMKVVKQGPCKILEIDDRYMMITARKLQDGTLCYNLWEQSGRLFFNAEADKKSENSPDISGGGKGQLKIGGVPFKVAAWKNKNDDGLEYLSVKFTPEGENQSGGGDQSGGDSGGGSDSGETDYDDEIPF